MEENTKPTKEKTDLIQRHILFLQYYLDPKSKTFSNAYRSGIKSGFSEEYSKVILSRDLDWLSEAVNKEQMVKKALRNLNKLLDEEKDKRILLDTTKFVAERLGKLNEETEVNFKGQMENIGSDTDLEVVIEEVIKKLKYKKFNEQKGVNK